MLLTLTQAQTALDAWIAADLAVAKGQSYTMNGRSLTLANVKETPPFDKEALRQETLNAEKAGRTEIRSLFEGHADHNGCAGTGGG